MNIYSLPFAEKVKENKDAFLNKVVDISAKLDTIPEAVMITMNNESGLNPKADNPTSSATGLIQFTEQTAKGLGTTTAALAKMSNVQQLDYVYKYLSKYKGKMKDAGDVYLAVFFPLALYEPDNYVFPKWVINANKAKDGFAIFDLNKDGTLTKAEFKNYVFKKYGKYLPAQQSIASNNQPNDNVNKQPPILPIILIGIGLSFIAYFFLK